MARSPMSVPHISLTLWVTACSRRVQRDEERASRSRPSRAQVPGTVSRGGFLSLCRFSDAGNDEVSTRSCGRRSKSAKARNRGARKCAEQRRGLYYGDLATARELQTGRLRTAIRLERDNLNVLARILLNGNFTFCPACDLNELGVAKKHARQLLRDELHDKPWIRQQAIDLDFESLDRPSWTVFDLLVKTIIVLSRVTAFP